MLRLGIAFFLVLVGAVLAPVGAQAAYFNSEQYPVTVEGAQEPGEEVVLTIDGGPLECESFKLSGTLEEPAESLSLHPTLSGCSAFGFVSATVNTTGCDLRFDLGAETSEDDFEGAAEVSCETGKKITITAATCEATIASGSSTGSKPKFSNDTEAAPEEVVLGLASSTLPVTKVKDGFLCPFAGTGSTTAALAGKVRFLATNGAEQVPVRGGFAAVLCQVEPEGPKQCPTGSLYAGEVIGTLNSSPAKMIAKTGGAPVGEVKCAQSVFKGQFNALGLKGGLAGLTSFKLENPGSCTSTIAGIPKAEVTLGSLTGSFFRYKVGPDRFDFVLKEANSRKARFSLLLEPNVGPPALCKYESMEPFGVITNGTPNTQTILEMTAVWDLEAGQPGSCPTKVEWSAIKWELTRTGPGKLFLAKGSP